MPKLSKIEFSAFCPIYKNVSIIWGLVTLVKLFKRLTASC